MKIRDILVWLDMQGIDYEFKGDVNVEIIGFASLDSYKPGCITWIKSVEIFNRCRRPYRVALAVIQHENVMELDNVIITDRSKEVFFGILHHFWGERREKGKIDTGTVVSDEVLVDPTVSIGCNCSIVGNVEIGPDTIIEHNVIIQGKVRIGRRCYIQSGAVIGIDGFGYFQNSDTKKKTMVEHFGGVYIGDDVFIGSHVNIARGTIEDTVINDGVKIAPSTHIGHNNYVGKNAVIICSNIYGSVHTGDGTYITSSTVENQIEIGENTVIGMGSIVTKSIEANVIAYGIPAKIKRVNDSGL